MDDLSKHDEDDQKDTTKVDESLDTDVDEGGKTPANTDGDASPEDDSKKTPAEEEQERQKDKWLAEIRGGKKTLDDMPENLSWLRKKIEPELSEKKETRSDEKAFDEKVDAAVSRRQDKRDFGLLIDHLEENVNAETVAQVMEEFKSFEADGVSPLKALTAACRLAGLKDSGTIVAERRKKGMLLPPSGSKKRETVHKDGLTEMERKLGGGLPPGFKA